MTIESIRARLEAATPGKWRAVKSDTKMAIADPHTNEFNKPIRVPAHVRWEHRDEQGRRVTSFICDCAGATMPNDANADFIAHAPTDIAALLKVAAIAREVTAAELLYHQRADDGGCRHCAHVWPCPHSRLREAVDELEAGE